jgi:hypothetical protein
MSSHRQILYQVVFATKNTKTTIDEDQSENYKNTFGEL